MATYNDYPQAAVNAAKKALRWREEYGDEVKGGTSIGWTRANQLANKESLSYSTIARMAAFNRHRKNSKIDPKFADTPWKDRGYVAWLIWGGTAGVDWAIRKAQGIRDGRYSEVREDKAMVDGIISILKLVSDKDNRKRLAVIQMEDFLRSGVEFNREDFIRRIGLTDSFAVQDKDGSIKESKKAPNSDSPNPNPKGVGEGGKLGPAVIKSIANKVKKHNDQYPDKKVSIAAARKVVLRGMGAYNTSRSPFVRSATQWGLARLNAFLYLIVRGTPQNPKYITDNDLLPKSHPKSSK
jgi:hypothetical protein